MMTQSWRDAVFLHWAVDPAEVTPLLPPRVHPDLYGGATYVGLVLFRMVDAGLGRGPAIPWAGTFLETNVRLYTVDETGRRGIVFRSLDASRLAVVLGARLAFGLPYRWARMRVSHRATPEGVESTYTSRTRTPARHGSHVRVRVNDPLEGSDPLADFLTCRWGLHHRHGGRDFYIPNVHEPWPLHHAELLACDDELVAAAGFPALTGRVPDHVVASPGVGVRFGFPRSTATGR